MIDGLGSNSHKSKETTAEPKPKLQKVANGTVTKKKSDSSFFKFFVPEDVTSVRHYILIDVIVPLVKTALTDTLNVILYPGEGKQSRGSTASKISYRGFYDSAAERDRLPDRGVSSVRSRTAFDLDMISFTTKSEAKAILEVMDEAIDTFGVISVGDFYDLAGVTTENHAVNKYGWTNIRSAEPVRVRDGWILKLPKAQPIN